MKAHASPSVKVMDVLRLRAVLKLGARLRDSDRRYEKASALAEAALTLSDGALAIVFTPADVAMCEAAIHEALATVVGLRQTPAQA